MSSNRLSIENLSVVYQSSRGSTPAVKDLSLNVEEGEFIAVLGPSGCGKSTLLQVAAGLLNASSGAIKLGGEAIRGPRKDVGIVFQAPTLLPWKNVLDNVMVPIQALGLSTKEYLPRAQELLELVGLESFAKHYPKELSGGMQQRVGIARSLIHDPAVLLMDEPFAALDAMTRETMSLELQSLWLKTRKSVLFITHSIPEAVFLADRVIVLSSRPAQVVDIVDVNIPRAREMEVMGSAEFGHIANRLRSHFTHGGKTAGVGRRA